MRRSRARRSSSPAARWSSSASSSRAAKRASAPSSPSPASAACARRAAPQQLERDRGLVREEPEQIHLRERERRALGAVEHLEHAEGGVLGEKRHCHEGTRHVARRLGGVAREARLLRQVLDDERLPRHEHPAGDACARREAAADERPRAFARDRLEHELVGLLVEEQDGRRLRVKDAARRLDRRLQERAERRRPRRGRRPQPLRAGRSCRAADVRRGLVQHALQLERRQLGMLAEYERAEARDVRCREAVPGRA